MKITEPKIRIELTREEASAIAKVVEYLYDEICDGFLIHDWTIDDMIDLLSHIDSEKSNSRFADVVEVHFIEEEKDHSGVTEVIKKPLADASILMDLINGK